MSVPDELVAAAAAALCAASHGPYPPPASPCGGCVMAARIALQAAFAKLGECEEAQAVAEAGIVRGTGHAEWDGTPCPVLNDSDELAADALTALAREFGGQE